jgi:hypothetical protein
MNILIEDDESMFEERKTFREYEENLSEPEQNYTMYREPVQKHETLQFE